MHNMHGRSEHKHQEGIVFWLLFVSRYYFYSLRRELYNILTIITAYHSAKEVAVSYSLRL